MPERPRDPVRVAAVPAAHPYVAAITPDDGSTIVLPDPVVDPAEPRRWWPPAVLSPGWLRAHRAEIDLVHVHFGMESLPEGRLEATLDAADELGVPVVHTVHDLDNPQLADQARHRRDLDLIVPRAARLVTLTDAAAERVQETWGRRATVLPHPTLVDAPPPKVDGPRGAFVIGTHLRDLRPSIDGVTAVRGLLAALQELRRDGIPAQGRVLLNDRTRDEAAVDEIARLVRDRADCVVERRPRPDDAALLEEVDALDVALLPYAHGTHSGWVELCHDRGVVVVGPAWLPMARQHPDDQHGFADLAALATPMRAAIAAATRPGSPERARLVERRLAARALERKGIRAQHAALYRALMDSRL